MPVSFWDVDAAAQAGAAASNDFAFRLFREVGAEPRNTVCCPVSLGTALSMAALGAKGETREQLEHGLGKPVAGGMALEEAYPALSRFLVTVATETDVAWHAANRLWGQDGLAFDGGFLGALDARYGAPLERVDFARGPEAARARINLRIAEQTRQRILQLLPPRSVGADTRLMLTNAVYFKGRWDEPFGRDDTVEGASFHVSAREQVRVAMMHQVERYEYAEDDRARWLELPYTGVGLSMVVGLPRALDGLPPLVAALDARTLDARMGALRSRRVALSLPRFKVAAAFDLSRVLARLGMALPFDEARADFTGMVTRPEDRLALSAVVHQANLDVNEEGTEAAAASAVGMVEATAALDDLVDFTVDRPFVFLLRDKRSGAVLFLGQVVDPSR